MADKTPNLDSLFMAAMEIDSPEQRMAFLRQSCGDNKELLAELTEMMSAQAEIGSFLEQPAAGLEDTLVSDASEKDRAASLDAGLATAFDGDAAVVLGDANHSVLRSLANTLNEVPQVSLRESAAEGDDRISRPGSPEIPQHDPESRYRLDGEIARGGMGAIIKGRDTDLGRDLAIKVLLDSHKDKPEVIQRFIEEAQIGGQLQHPGIAPIYELGQFADKRPFFAMKLVKGQTLSSLLVEREDAADERGKMIGIFEQICQTMAYAHSRGVIHRDLKPANIMVGAFGEVQVMDWGLAKVLQTGGVADEKKAKQSQQGQSIIQTMRSAGSDVPGSVGSAGSETQMGSVMGTPAYMPPEQALGEIDQLDQRADVFGLGSILCEILTGKPPYVGEDGTQVYRMASRGKLNDAFSRLDSCGADEDLITLTKHCLELEPADRPKDAGALAERVTAYLESVESKLRETEVERASEAARADESRKRARVTLALAASILLAITLGGGGWLMIQQQAAKHLAAITSNINDRLGDARLHQQLANAVDVSSDQGLIERARELNLALESAGDAAELIENSDVSSGLQDSSSALLTSIERQLRIADRAAAEAKANRELKQELELIRVNRAAGGTIGDAKPSTVSVKVEKVEELASTLAEEDSFRENDYLRQYRDAFRKGGLNLAFVTDEEEKKVIQKIKDSPIRETLISAIDDWILALSAEGSLPPELQLLSWRILKPTDTIDVGSDLKIQSDDSLLMASPAGPQNDRHAVEFQPAPGTVSAIRMEWMTDKPIREFGPGPLDPGGVIHFQEFKVFRVQVDQTRGPVPTLDAWGSQTGDKTGQKQQVVFRLQSPLEIKSGETLVIEFRQRHAQALVRFRFSTTAAMEVSKPISPHRLQRLVDLADYSDWRRKLRQASAKDDVEKLKQIAMEDEVRRQHPVLIAWLGRSLRQSGALEESIAVLHHAQINHPEDLEINLELGFALQSTDDRKVDSLSFFRSAVALRPQSTVTLNALTAALMNLERYDEGTLLVRRAVEFDPENPMVYDALGRVLQRQGKLDQAIAEFRKAIELEKEYVVAYLRLGSALFEQNKPDEAIDAFKQAIELDSNDAFAYTSLGNVLLFENRMDEAAAAYKKAIQLNPNAATTYNNLGNALEKQDKVDEAIDALHKAIELDPDFAMAYASLGNAFQAGNKLDQAIAAYNKSIELDPTYPIAYNNMGTAFSRLNRLEDAVAAYHKSIELDPKRFLTYYKLGQALLSQNKLAEAVVAYRKASDLNPNEQAVFIQLGLSLYKTNKFDEAITAYRKAIKLNPNEALTYTYLGNALSDRSQLDQAVDAFQKAIEINPKFSLAFLNLGIALQRQDKLQEAIAAFEKAIEIEPDFAEVFIQLGVALSKQDKLKEATAAFQKAIEINPEFADAFIKLGAALSKQKKLKEAITAYSKGIELDPNQSTAYTDLGHLLLEDFRLEEALAAMKKAIEIDHKNALAHLGLGAILMRKGNLNEAMTAYRTAIEINPNSADAHQRFGVFLSNSGIDLDEAIKQFQKAIEINPKFAIAHANIGVTQTKRGAQREAIQAFRNATQIEPNNAAYHRSLGSLLSNSGIDLDEAVRELRKATELDPSDSVAFDSLGVTLEKRGDKDEAIQAFRKAIEVNPNNAKALTDLGSALGEREDLEEAIVVFRKAIQLAPKFTFARMEFGSLLAKSGRNLDEAVEQFQQVIQQDPENVLAYDFISGILVYQGKLAEAIAESRKLIERFPSYERGYVKLVWLLANAEDPALRNPTEALEIARKATELNPMDARHWCNLGVAHYRAKNWQDSVDAFRKADQLIGGDGDRKHRFFLAMAWWQLGNEVQAREAFEQAVSWLNENNIKDGDQIRFRDEAEALLKNSLKTQPKDGEDN